MSDNFSPLISRRTLLSAAFAPWPRKGPTAWIEQADLFHQGDGGVHTYRIPALIETHKRTLLAVVDARHDSNRDLPARISLVMKRSSDRGRTWSEARTIRQVPEGGVGDPSLLLDRKSGRVWCFHAYGPPGIGFGNSKAGPQTIQVHAMWSDDDGATWSAPQDLTPQLRQPEWQGMFATSGTHFETSRGRFLVPLVVRDGAGLVSSRNAYSDDRGKTWKVGPAICMGSDESKAVEVTDGVVLQNLRMRKIRTVARSYDGGITFGPPVPDGALIDPICNAGLARYRRWGRDLVVFTNAASLKRENLTVRISEDDGHVWRRSRVIHRGPAGYSTVIPLRDGTLGVLYERGNKYAAERITFARFDLDWITGAESRA
jgi:sialidase-1